MLVVLALTCVGCRDAPLGGSEGPGPYCVYPEWATGPPSDASAEREGMRFSVEVLGKGVVRLYRLDEEFIVPAVGGELVRGSVGFCAMEWALQEVSGTVGSKIQAAADHPPLQTANPKLMVDVAGQELHVVGVESRRFGHIRSRGAPALQVVRLPDGGEGLLPWFPRERPD